MAEVFVKDLYNPKTAIPEPQFSSVFSIWRPSVTDPGKISVGDPYIDFKDNNNKYYTRNFNHSEIVPKKELIHKTAWYFNQGKEFVMPLMEKIKEGQGKIIGYIKGQVQRDINTGGNILRINNIETTPIKPVVTLHVFKVSGTLSPRYRFTNQKPESLT